VAVDLYEEKLERAERERARLGLDPAKLETRAVDLTVGTGGLDASFDRVLVDAPCTGLGTLHRRPELLLRLGPGDPARLAELQLAILANAAKLVRPGGLLVYAVCSPTAEEGAGVVARFSASHPEFEVVTARPRDAIAADSDGIVRIGPWSGETAAPDAYQVVRWTKRSSA
jgi:16S rRNA (cytosine967-C5)-methyltransferase